MSKITIDAIYSQAIIPSPSDIDYIIREILSCQKLSSCVSRINQLRAVRGISLTGIITALSQELQRFLVPGHSKIIWLEGLANIEYHLECGGSEEIQTGALVGILRQSGLVIDETDSARLVSIEKSDLAQH
jgi:replication factor C subunit 3/5